MIGFFSGLALVLLTLVGYSSSSVLAGWGRNITPGLFDLAVILGLWVGALATQNALGKGWALLFWLVMGSVAGAAVFLMRKIVAPPAKLQRVQTVEPAENDPKFFSWLWQSWKTFTMDLGNFQGRILLAWFYFVVVTPFGLLVRLLSDPLKVRHEHKNSGWLARTTEYPDLDDARKQF